jgi:hypothetical protein
MELAIGEASPRRGARGSVDEAIADAAIIASRGEMRLVLFS